VPLNRVESEISTLGDQRSAVLDLNRRLAVVRDSSKELFGFRNPFDEKIARSSDENVITASANRAAIESSSTVTVERIAAADKFASSSLSRDYRVEAGRFEFTIGDERVVVPFTGGTLDDFAAAVNARADGSLRARVINDTPTTQLLTIEATATGAANRISFGGAALDFGLAAGLIRRSGAGVVEIDVGTAVSRTADGSNYSVADGSLTLAPGATLRIPVVATSLTDLHELQFSYRTELIAEEVIDRSRPPGPTLRSAGAVTFEGITLQNAASEITLPSFESPAPEVRRDELRFLTVEGGGRSSELGPLTDSTELRPASLGLGALAVMDALVIENRNTHRTLHITDVRLIDTASRGDQTPVNAVAQARDAILRLDGIEVRRPTNVVEDLLPGVTLTLNGASTEPVDLDIVGDHELVKSRVIEFIGSYNRLLTEIDILTRSDDAVITDAGFLSDEEQDDARSRLGLFQSDLALIQLKSALQRTIMNAYPTDANRELALLSQIGVATDVRRSGSGLDGTRLRGYLEVDEALLDIALAKERTHVRQLFGNDTDNDLIIDAGVAYVVDRFLTSYVQPNGVIDARLATLDGNLSRRSSEVERLEVRLDRREQQLRVQFTEMEAAVQSLERSSAALQNLGRQ
jgi:flagellar hook-associated protein 2